MGPALVAVAIMAGLGLFFAVVLALGARFLQVHEDPRLGTVEGMLPGTNCGACGEPGCAAFARTLVAGTATPAACTVSNPAGREAIAGFLGVEVGEAIKRVARLRCAGAEGLVGELARYQGLSTCRASTLSGGGGRACTWGCLGLGDCDRACTFDAIHMAASGLPVVDAELCTACGDCVKACPLDLFVVDEERHGLFVACATPLVGEEARVRCAVACDGCGRCAADAPPELIQMVDGLPRIDWDRGLSAGPRATWRCPTGAIQWLGETSAVGRVNA